MSPVEAQATARIGSAVGDHLLHDRHEHRHAEVLERPGVRVAAHASPRGRRGRARGRSARPRTGWCRPRPSRRCSRRGRAGTPTPSCPRPPSRRARSCACSGRRTGASRRPGDASRSASRSCDDLEQVAAGGAAVDRLVERMLAGAAGDAAERGAIGHLPIIRTRRRPGRPVRNDPALGTVPLDAALGTVPQSGTVPRGLGQSHTGQSHRPPHPPPTGTRSGTVPQSGQSHATPPLGLSHAAGQSHAGTPELLSVCARKGLFTRRRPWHAVARPRDCWNTGRGTHARPSFPRQIQSTNSSSAYATVPSSSRPTRATCC